MPRPPRCRRICGVPQVDTFCPNGCKDAEPILLTLDEYEVIRLVDLEQQTHEQCAAQMDISRSTVQEIYEVARRKIAACLVHGKPLHITGGNYRICGGQEAAHCGLPRVPRPRWLLAAVERPHVHGLFPLRDDDLFGTSRVGSFPARATAFAAVGLLFD